MSVGSNEQSVPHGPRHIAARRQIRIVRDKDDGLAVFARELRE